MGMNGAHRSRHVMKCPCPYMYMRLYVNAHMCMSLCMCSNEFMTSLQALDREGRKTGANVPVNVLESVTRMQNTYTCACA